jgi:drug/metabolite transporter (DMT)-like permease
VPALDQSTRPTLQSDRRGAVSPALVWAGLLTVYVVWGSTYLGIRVAVESLPPFGMAAVRFALAGVLLAGWSRATREGRHDGQRAPALTGLELRDSFVVGALLLGGGMGLVAWGEQTVPSGIAALLVAMMPVWLAILSALFVGERLPRIAVVGIGVGFVGVGLLAWPSNIGGAALQPAGLAALIASPISWATGSLYAATRAKLPSRPLLASALQMLAGSIVLAAMALLSGEAGAFRPAAVTSDSLLSLAYLILVGSLVGYTAYGWLLRVAPLPLVATYAYVNPIVAVVLGAAVLAEPIGIRTLVAGAIIVVAVALIITARSRYSRPSRARTHAPTPAIDGAERAA